MTQFQRQDLFRKLSMHLRRGDQEIPFKEVSFMLGYCITDRVFLSLFAHVTITYYRDRCTIELKMRTVEDREEKKVLIFWAPSLDT